MRKEIEVTKEHDLLSLISGIAYCTVPAWYGCSNVNLKMDMILPKDRQGCRRPVILWLCGGGFSVVGSGVWMPELMYFARRGFTIVSAEYRTVNDQPFPAQLEDVKSCIRFLKAHAQTFGIDPDRIFVSGESAGGALAGLAAVYAGDRSFDVGDYLAYSSDIAGVVTYYGIFNAEKEQEALEAGSDEGWMKAFVGEWTPEAVCRASAVEHVTPDVCPMLLLHGGKDGLVPPDQSEEFYQKLTEQGVSCDLIVVKGAEHGDPVFYQSEVKELVYEWLRKQAGI